MTEDIKKGLLGIVVDETEVSKVMPEINSLTYRGYAAQDLCEYCRFEEVAYLILNKDLPNTIQLRQFEKEEKNNRELTKNFQSLYKNNQTVKNFDIAQTQLNKLFAGAKRDSAAGDLSMIFTYMKVLDPTSVVREGEQATAQNAAGIPERVRNLYNKLITGERLTKKQRQDFVKSGIGLFQSNQVAKDAFQKSFETSFNTYNIDKNNVFFDADIRPKKININGQVQDVPSGTKLINYKITTNAKGFKKGTFVYRTPDGTIFEIEEK